VGGPSLALDLGSDTDRWGTGIQLVVLFTLLSFAPAMLIGLSAFVRIVIVLAFVRQAVGTQQMPPNQVILALALFLTFFVMMPTFREINHDAVEPYLAESLPPIEAMQRGFAPLRKFMLRQTREKDLALDTARRVAAALRKKGFHVIETRTHDVFISLGSRTAVSNSARNCIFVSVHYNWAPRRGARGIEIYYFSPRSWRLATNILKQSLRAYPTENRGVKRNNFHVLRENRRPAVLCELGFLSNPQDNRYVQSPLSRQRLAESVAAGILAERQAADR
jgi:hypothetical protein